MKRKLSSESIALVKLCPMVTTDLCVSLADFVSLRISAYVCVHKEKPTRESSIL